VRLLLLSLFRHYQLEQSPLALESLVETLQTG
jgi:hypothetical protein